jgi:hypothetical protein
MFRSDVFNCENIGHYVRNVKSPWPKQLQRKSSRTSHVYFPEAFMWKILWECHRYRRLPYKNKWADYKQYHRHVVRWKSTDVSEEHIASIFKVNKISWARNQSKSRWQADYLTDHSVEHIAYFFDAEDGGDVFLRKVGWHSTDYTVLYLRRW